MTRRESMELERIDVKNVKDLESRAVICTYLPTFSMDDVWIRAFTQVLLLDDLDYLISFSSYNEKTYAKRYYWKNVDLKQEVPDAFHIMMQKEDSIIVMGESRLLDCRIQLCFSSKEQKITLMSPDDYIVNRFLLGGEQKKRGSRLFNQYMHRMEGLTLAYLALQQPIYVEKKFPILKKQVTLYDQN